ncbi:MAG TPA: CHAD domain-containing protein [Vicinamibacteria bacterium]|nr:CHAD domain-containing protein [Vicinamibacteria bacterium]
MPARPATLADRPTHLLQQAVRMVFRHLPKALAGDQEAVHDMRVSTRRLRVALPVLAQDPTGRRARRALGVLRELTRAAGGSRDLDVCVELFEARWTELQTRPPELALVRRRLRAARSRSRHHMAEVLMDIEIAGVRRDLRKLLARGVPPMFTALRRLRDTSATIGNRLLATLEALGQRYDPEELHRARMVARRLRYVGELAGALRGHQEEDATLFRDLQTRLGHVRDHFVLASWLTRQATSARVRGQAPLAREAQAQAAFFRQESHRHHQRLLEAAPLNMARRALTALGGRPTDAATA